MGPPVVLAERLSKLASPGEVLTEPRTLALAPGVEAEPLGPKEAKGLGLVEAWRVEAVGLDLGPDGENLLAALRDTFPHPFGRLNLVGPPGSGKSLILEKFLETWPHPVVVLDRMGPETPLRATLRQAVERTFGHVERFVALGELPPPLALALRYSLGLEARPPGSGTFWNRPSLKLGKGFWKTYPIPCFCWPRTSTPLMPPCDGFLSIPFPTSWSWWRAVGPSSSPSWR